MKKQLLTVAATVLMGYSAFAGGYLANTNQNAAFLRNPAQGATISVQGAYSNPAGVGFLDHGWYLGLNIQNARQTREIESTYAPFALGIKNEGSDKVKYVGKTYAPVIPSFDLAYVHNEHFFGSFTSASPAAAERPFSTTDSVPSRARLQLSRRLSTAWLTPTHSNTTPIST